MRQTDYVILGLLAEQPLSGYQIKKIVDIRFGFFWSESFGQIFPALRALTAKGYAHERTDEPAGRRAARVFQITPAGKAALVDWLSQPVGKESYRLEILLKTYFSCYAEPAAMLSHLDTFERNHVQQLGLLERFETELTQLIDADANHRDILRVIDCGKKVNRAYLDWCRETRAYFEEKQAARSEAAQKGRKPL